MTEYQAGRTSGVFVVGARTEEIVENYKKEASSLESMKNAFALASRALEDHISHIDRQLKAAQIPIKEAEVSKRSVQQCVAVIAKLYNDAEAKRLAAMGAVTALTDLVQNIKRIYDAEQHKLKQHNDFEAQPTDQQEPIDRPVGVPPFNVSEAVTRPKKSRQKKADAT
jgi:hypothetical protein